MATQYLTIAKLAGRAGEFALQLFDAWKNARLVDNPNEWDPQQWPADICEQADRFAEGLRTHGHEPPVVFFIEYVDMWSFCPSQRFLGLNSQHGLRQMMGHRYELSAMRLPLPPFSRQTLEQVLVDGQFDEDHLFADLTLRAADAWQGLVDAGALIFLRRVIRGSVDDEEIIESAMNLPEWASEWGKAASGGE